MADQIRVVAMTDDHAERVLAIYQAGIDEGNATFDTAAPTWAHFRAHHLLGHSLVATTGDVVLGWVAVSPASARAVYAGVVEDSVYVSAGARGRGIGRTLLDAVIASTEVAGIWTIQAGIFPENTASVGLHLAGGFRVIGTRDRPARQHGRWRDVVLMERRSALVH